MLVVDRVFQPPQLLMKEILHRFGPTDKKIGWHFTVFGISNDITNESL